MKPLHKAIWAIVAFTVILYCACFAYYGLVLKKWPTSEADVLLLGVPIAVAFLFLIAVLFTYESVRRRKRALLVMTVLFVIMGLALAVGTTIERVFAYRHRVERDRRDAQRRQVVGGILDEVLPLVTFASGLEPSREIGLPLLVLEWDRESDTFRESSLYGMPTEFDPWFSDNPEMTYRNCTVVFVKETGREHAFDYQKTSYDEYQRHLDAEVDQTWKQFTGQNPPWEGLSPVAVAPDPSYVEVESAPAGPVIGKAESVDLAVCLITWPDKRVVGVKTFTGHPPSSAIFDPKTPASERVRDGKREAEEAISRWIEPWVGE